MRYFSNGLKSAICEYDPQINPPGFNVTWGKKSPVGEKPCETNHLSLYTSGLDIQLHESYTSNITEYLLLPLANLLAHQSEDVSSRASITYHTVKPAIFS